MASSHSDAPLIKLDPQANLTDVYAFIGTKYNNPGIKVLNVVVNVHPFCEPGDGVTYDKFADDALYNIHVTDPATGAVITTYQFKFSAVNSGYKFGNTILSYGRGTGGAVGPITNIGDSEQNYTQTYTVTKVDSIGNSTLLGSGMCPPPNVGPRTTPSYNDTTGTPSSNTNFGRAISGATTEAGLDPYTKQAVTSATGGGVNAEIIARLTAKDRTGDDPASPRNVMRGMYVADPEAFGDDEEAMLDSLLSTVVSTDNYPGDFETVASWPTIGPGTRGVLNAMSPKYFSVADDLVAVSPKPPVVWVHGTADAIVGDASLFDLAQLGKLGAVPGWPGEDACPPQPMVSQTRAVLERYAAAGGAFTEVELAGCGHSPHIERPADFLAALTSLARQAPSASERQLSV